ncbi:MAG: EI24 domain-containing protein [Castellaniella sp.]
MNQAGQSAALPPPAGGLASLGLALRRALRSLLHPAMLAALFLPFIIALISVIVLLWFFWSPLNEWLQGQMGRWDMINAFDQWLVTLGLFSFKLYLVPLLAIGLLLPMGGLLGLVIAAIFVMPIVLRHLEKREYVGVERRGEHAVTVGVLNAVLVGAVFIAGWVLTMPLWLMPPLAVLLPLFWWAYAFSRMLRVDALVEHATSAERRWLWRRHNGQYWLLGLCLSLLNLFPPAWLILPVFSALVFAHFSLEALRRHRDRDASSQLSIAQGEDPS